MILKSKEVNTGGGSIVTIIDSNERGYVLVVNDEAVAAYQSEEDFWDGVPALSATYTQS